MQCGEVVFECNVAKLQCYKVAMWHGCHTDVEVAKWVVMTYMLKLQFGVTSTLGWQNNS